ncbi:MAG: T9SS type A sorting domain-containing protein, partial [Bacteroidales bacterium]|nr:T9SS type A sorting domain-containing protein [Bacteroidales bacterium]
TIQYRTDYPAIVEINIYDLYGKLLTTIVRAYKATGKYSLTWNGEGLPKGTYIVRTAFNQRIVSQNLIVKQ